MMSALQIDTEEQGELSFLSKLGLKIDSRVAESTVTVLLYCLGIQWVPFTTDMISEGQEHSPRQESLSTVCLDLTVKSLTYLLSHLISFSNHSTFPCSLT